VIVRDCVTRFSQTNALDSRRDELLRTLTRARFGSGTLLGAQSVVTEILETGFSTRPRRGMAFNGGGQPMLLRSSRLVLFCTLGLAASTLAACGDDGQDDGGRDSGSGGMAGTGGGGFGGSAFNQCGVAAPLPAETGQCAAVAAPGIVDFDDYAGTAASSYTFSVPGKPPVDAVSGLLMHVGDGSDMNGGTAVITTEMVTGEGDAGYALQIANTNAMNWGGLLMFSFSLGGAAGCLDARDYEGLEFAIKGASPSGRFGVSLGMLDTTPVSDLGLCDSPTASDCKNATIELSLPEDAAAWTHVQLPWSALTPGVGSSMSCVPVTGQNIVRLVIQPFMSYPPPDYMFEPGAYTIAVDNVRFY
jgi:hypothetical protein